MVTEIVHVSHTKQNCLYPHKWARQVSKDVYFKIVWMNSLKQQQRQEPDTA